MSFNFDWHSNPKLVEWNSNLLKLLESCFTAQDTLNFINVPCALERKCLCSLMIQRPIKKTCLLRISMQNICLFDLLVFKEGFLKSLIVFQIYIFLLLFLLVLFFPSFFFWGCVIRCLKVWVNYSSNYSNFIL